MDSYVAADMTTRQLVDPTDNQSIKYVTIILYYKQIVVCVIHTVYGGGSTTSLGYIVINELIFIKSDLVI